VLSRRELLAAAAALLAVGPSAGPGQDVVARLLRDRASARRVGAAYLAAHPEEASPERLLQALRSALGPVDAAPAAVLRHRLAARVRDDFARADVVVVRGWWLSRTEARLAALVACS
jgi:hypothetical protein